MTTTLCRHPFSGRLYAFAFAALVAVTPSLAQTTPLQLEGVVTTATRTLRRDSDPWHRGRRDQRLRSRSRANQHVVRGPWRHRRCSWLPRQRVPRVVSIPLHAWLEFESGPVPGGRDSVERSQHRLRSVPSGARHVRVRQLVKLPMGRKVLFTVARRLA